MKLRKELQTTNQNETLAISLPVDSPAMYSIEFIAVLIAGDGYGGEIRLKQTMYCDADGHTIRVGDFVSETRLIGGTLRGIATNLQAPRIWVGVIDPVDGAVPAITFYVQGASGLPCSWNCVATVEKAT